MWPFKSRPKEPSLDSSYSIQYPEHEIKVVETVNGFILRRKSDGQYRVNVQDATYDAYRLHHSAPYPRWRPTRQGKESEHPKHSMSYIPESWQPIVYATLAVAVHNAIKLEKAADARKTETERRKNFVEREVWR